MDPLYPVVTFESAIKSGKPRLLDAYLGEMKGRSYEVSDQVFYFLAGNPGLLDEPYVEPAVKTAVEYSEGKAKLWKLPKDAHFIVLVGYRPDLFARYAHPRAHLTNNFGPWHELFAHALRLTDEKQVARVAHNALMMICPPSGLNSADEVVEFVRDADQHWKDKLDVERLRALAQQYFDRLENDQEFGTLAASLTQYNAKK